MALLIKGIAPQHQLTLLPCSKGIIYIFGDCEIDQALSTISLGKLVEISEQNDLYSYACKFVKEKGKPKEGWAFCFSETAGILDSKMQKTCTRVVDALNLKFKPEFSNISASTYKIKHNKNVVMLHIKYDNYSTNWNLSSKLIQLNEFEEIPLRIPQAAYM